MKKLLIVIDMQNDFIDGPLGTPEARDIIPKVVEKINTWNGDIAITQDTHDDYYFKTDEGQHLPIVHCIDGSDGWFMNDEVRAAISNRDPSFRRYVKDTFGCERLAEDVENNRYSRIEIVGLCTDVCVITNAILIKTCSPDTEIIVDASCCAGTTPMLNDAALAVMKSCHIEVIE